MLVGPGLSLSVASAAPKKYSEFPLGSSRPAPELRGGVAPARRFVALERESEAVAQRAVEAARLVVARPRAGRRPPEEGAKHCLPLATHERLHLTRVGRHRARDGAKVGRLQLAREIVS